MHPVGKTVRFWIEKNDYHLFYGLDVFYYRAFFFSGGGDGTTRAGCRWENTVLICFLSACHAPSPASSLHEGDILRTGIAPLCHGL